jgi:tRNA nucleotidyltransferase (CCA-adding enzyme)
MIDDLHRRDFSINTLAVRLDGSHFGELRDDLGGLDDLDKKIVRVLYIQSFIDDPTRMYRAVRYEMRYGFKVADETLALIPKARGLIDRLSAQRIRHELDLILAEPKAASMLRRLAELDLLKPIHAALSFDNSTQHSLDNAKISPEYVVPHLTPVHLRWLLWLMSLPEKQIESVNKRLHFTAPLFESLLASSRLFADLAFFIDKKPSQCVESLQELPLLAVYAVSLAALDGKSKAALENYLVRWRHVKSKTTGNDLKKLGIPPGLRYQEILSRLRAAWLDGEIYNEEEEKNLLIKTLEKS